MNGGVQTCGVRVIGSLNGAAVLAKEGKDAEILYLQV